jgi:hypothetical protein
MSAMGHLAHASAQARATQTNGGTATNAIAGLAKNLPPYGDEGEDGPAGGQAELSIAVDSTGQHIVVGFNDTRGFDLSPVSVSGFAYSDDGGAMFVDGGQLPTTNLTAFNGSFNGTSYPKVYGDPDVKYVPGGNGLQFIYASIFMKGLGTAPNFTGTAQTLCIHRSTDGGHTWQGPFEITTATNPNGTSDAADKEFIDVDPDTGRVIVSWSNFSSAGSAPGGVEISTTYCDNIMTGNPPVWSPRVVLNSGSGNFDTGCIPRFAGNGSNDVYVAWARDSSTTSSYGHIAYGNICVAKSADNGAAWSPAVTLTTNFFPIDYILGNDRVHSFPGLSVDVSAGTNKGNVYVAYANNSLKDGADIAFQRSTDGGVTFSAPVFLNSRPGSDRAQWFPSVAVDKDTGRVNVMFDDQGIATSGDLMEVTWVHSDDGGLTWSKPSPLTARPQHAGYGNDTGQPNLGDYNGATAQGGALYAAFPATAEISPFTNGQPAARFSYPSFLPGLNPAGFKKATVSTAAINLGTVTFTDSGSDGFLDPGDTAGLFLPLQNFVTNPVLGLTTYSGVTATLTTTTPGVVITTGTQPYPNLAPGLSQTNAAPYVVNLQPGFVPGTRIEFALSVNSAQGNANLLFAQPTGTPLVTTVFSENFDGVAPGSLPTGWTTNHGGGNSTVPWTTVTNVPNAPGGNALFHINANDDPTDPMRWERAFGPSINIPTNAAYVMLDFDVWYNTEDDTDFNILAYDGFTLRVTDQTTGRNARSCLAEAFAESITTGNIFHFPKHLPRDGSSAYFQDMSVWGGYSGGWQHVRMKLPGMAGSTIQLRWEFTQDSNSDGTTVHPSIPLAGVAVDNIVMSSVGFATPAAFRSVSLTNGVLDLNWTAITGRTYTVQFKTNLTQTTWANLTNLTATTTNANAFDSITDRQRFYKLLLLP